MSVPGPFRHSPVGSLVGDPPRIDLDRHARIEIAVSAPVMAPPIRPMRLPSHRDQSRRIWCSVESFCLRSELASPPTNFIATFRYLSVSHHLALSQSSLSPFLLWARGWRPPNSSLNSGSIQCAWCPFRSLALEFSASVFTSRALQLLAPPSHRVRGRERERLWREEPL